MKPLLKDERYLENKNVAIQIRPESGEYEFLRLYEQLIKLTAALQRVTISIRGAFPQFDQNYGKLIDASHFLQGSIAIITKKLRRVQHSKKQASKNLDITKKFGNSYVEIENSGPTVSYLNQLEGKNSYAKITRDIISPDTIKLKLNPNTITDGKLAVLYGKNFSDEKRSLGISYKISPGSRIFAPQTGKIVFAGTFKGLGKLLIIECGNEYHLLIAGMGRINAKLGTLVTAGQQVAIMDTINRDPKLYLELRRKGRTVDPSLWLLSGPNQ